MKAKRKREPVATAAAQKAKAAPAKRAAEKVHAVAAAAEPAREQAVSKQSVAAGIVLASNCNVKDAAALKTSLCKLVDESADVTVDAGNVERVDTASMQLLCAFARARAAAGRKVVWLGISQVLQEAARLLGAESLLALPQTEFKGAAA